MSYVQQNLADGDIGNPSAVAWSALPTTLKNSNRYLARSLTALLASVGLELERGAEPHTAAALLLLRRSTEVLAEDIHRGWVEQRRAAGWRWGPHKDITERQSPALVSWSRLTEHERDKDRHFIRTLPITLRTIGLRLTRATTPAEPQPPAAVDGGAMITIGLESVEDHHGRFTISEPLPPPAPVIDPVRGTSDLVASASGAGHSQIPTRQDLEIIARLIHESYLNQRLGVGESLFSNASLRPWDHLEGSLKRSNRDAASDLWRLFESAGFALVRSDPDRKALSPTDLAHHLEGLAEASHEMWRQEKLAAGWLQADGPKNPETHTNPDLKDWGSLPETEREKTRQQVRDYPGILAEAGWFVRRIVE
ncbi:MAG: RyR domain-containing protein [bacterium]